MLASLAALATAFGHLGAFLDPDGNTRDMPLALVNEDRGAVLGQPVQFGRQVVDQIRAPNSALGHQVKVALVPAESCTRRHRLRPLLRRARRIGDFSQRLVGIAAVTTSVPVPARIEVLTNPASGSYAGTFSQTVAATAVDAVSRSASAQLADALTRAGVRLTPGAARVLGRPVEATVTVAQASEQTPDAALLPSVSQSCSRWRGSWARRLRAPPDVAAGRATLELVGHEVRRARWDASPARSWRAKVGTTLVIAVASAWLVTWMAVGVLGMEGANVWPLGGLRRSR